MARENVDALVRLVLRAQQVGVYVTPAFGPSGRLIHAVTRRNAVWQRLVHSGHDGRYGGISQVLCESPLEPANLRFIKLIGGCAIEVIKSHTAVDPMKIGFKFAVIGIAP